MAIIYDGYLIVDLLLSEIDLNEETGTEKSGGSRGRTLHKVCDNIKAGSNRVRSPTGTPGGEVDVGPVLCVKGGGSLLSLTDLSGIARCADSLKAVWLVDVSGSAHDDSGATWCKGTGTFGERWGKGTRTLWGRWGKEEGYPSGFYINPNKVRGQVNLRS